MGGKKVANAPKKPAKKRAGLGFGKKSGFGSQQPVRDPGYGRFHEKKDWKAEKKKKKELVKSEGGKKSMELSKKHPVTALTEYCQRKEWAPPIYKERTSKTGTFLFEVIVNETGYWPDNPATNKKLAKSECAAYCLNEMVTKEWNWGAGEKEEGAPEAIPITKKDLYAQGGRMPDYVPPPASVSGGFGEKMLGYMGWRYGEGLGYQRNGILEPIIVSGNVEKSGFGLNVDSSSYINPYQPVPPPVKGMSKAAKKLEQAKIKAKADMSLEEPPEGVKDVDGIVPMTKSGQGARPYYCKYCKIQLASLKLMRDHSVSKKHLNAAPVHVQTAGKRTLAECFIMDEVFYPSDDKDTWVKKNNKYQKVKHVTEVKPAPGITFGRIGPGEPEPVAESKPVAASKPHLLQTVSTDPDPEDYGLETIRNRDPVNWRREGYDWKTGSKRPYMDDLEREASRYEDTEEWGTEQGRWRDSSDWSARYSNSYSQEGNDWGKSQSYGYSKENANWGTNQFGSYSHDAGNWETRDRSDYSYGGAGDMWTRRSNDYSYDAGDKNLSSGYSYYAGDKQSSNYTYGAGDWDKKQSSGYSYGAGDWDEKPSSGYSHEGRDWVKEASDKHSQQSGYWGTEINNRYSQETKDYGTEEAADWSEYSHAESDWGEGNKGQTPGDYRLEEIKPEVRSTSVNVTNGQNQKNTASKFGFNAVMFGVKNETATTSFKAVATPKTSKAPNEKKAGTKPQAAEIHPVTHLDQICVKRKWPQPNYVVVTSGGPGSGGFVLEVEVNGQTYKHPQPASNMNKKLAKSEAAKFALKKLGL